MDIWTAPATDGMNQSSSLRLTKSRCSLYAALPLPDGGSFRLLEVQPGNGKDRILCQLKIHAIWCDTPQYEALSYAWGDVTDRIDITCDGKVVWITRNLFDALHRIRQPRHPRFIWADAICIDQQNMVERGRQVCLMGPIFRTAKRVLIWARRDPRQHAANAFQILCMIAEQPECLTNTTYNSMASLLLQRDMEALEAFYAILWFRRLWVIQEVVLSSSALMLWGTEKVPWAVVGRATKNIRADFELWSLLVGDGDAVENADLIWSLKSDDRNHSKRHSFRWLLQRTRVFEASMPEDRIFALLGLPNDDTEQGLLLVQPDYTMSLSDLYLKVARGILEGSSTLILLSAFRHGREIDETALTWVPHWDRFYHHILLGIDAASGLEVTGLPSHKNRIPPDEPGSLVVQGAQVDVFARCTLIISNEGEDAYDFQSDKNRLWTDLARIVCGHQAEQKQLRALARTMTGGTN